MFSSFGYEGRYRFEVYDEVDSTNSLALEKARNGAQGNLWILAKKQTHGRGRLGRSWYSIEGNLATSLLLIVPHSSFIYSPYFSFSAGIALIETLHCFNTKKSYIDFEGKERRRFQLKWPNDILGEGRKIGGVLVETLILDKDRVAVVIGMGMNVLSHPIGLAYPTTSLHSLDFDCCSIEKIFSLLIERWALLDKMRDTLELLEALEKIKNLWLSYAIDKDQKVVLRIEDRMEKGFFCGINDRYDCMIQLETGAQIVLSSAALDCGNFFCYE